MMGKFRKRAETVWCPKPQPALIANKDDVEWGKKIGKVYTIGQVIQRTKRFTGWQNMEHCEVCECLEEFHLENIGVFCTYPKKASEIKEGEET